MDDARTDSQTTLRDFVHVLRRRLWVVILVVAVATAAAYVVSVQHTKMYEATAKIIYAPQLTTTYPASGQAAVNPYAQEDALQGVAAAISNPVIQRQTAALVAKQVPASASFKLAVQEEAAASATALVNAVVDISATSSAPRVAQAAANGAAAAYIASRKQLQIAQLESALDALKAQMAAFKTASARTNSSYLLLAQSAQSLQISKTTATGDFSLAVPAPLPAAPYTPRPLRNAILAFGVSLFLIVSVVVWLEQFDTRLRSYREVADALDMPVVGRVPRVKKSTMSADPLAVVHDTRGPAAESLRRLRSNLDYLDVAGALSAVLVTSGMPGEGKSVTVCNLGVTLAMGGRRVVIIDADLRRPSVHRYMGLSNQIGLTSVVAGKIPLAEALQGYNLPPLDWSSNGGSSDGPNGGSTAGSNGSNGSAAAAERAASDLQQARRLYVLTAGPLPPNPGEIVASHAFEAILAELKASHVDFVLIDTPAFMSVSDAAAIAPHVDGVFALVDMDRATRPVLSEVKEFLDQLPTRKLGVIVVREKQTRASYHSYYHYASKA